MVYLHLLYHQIQLMNEENRKREAAVSFILLVRVNLVRSMSILADVGQN